METLFIPLAVGAAVVAAFLLGIWYAWDDTAKKNSQCIEALLCALLRSTDDLHAARSIVQAAWSDMPHHELPYSVIHMINAEDTETFNSYAIEYIRDLNTTRRFP